ncbi:hypothetical protein HGRIS_000502 [Hohenbuehelia grisea]|uniref:Secreted protein n=1 Tax=Hohenbuehelia grisea TaxID=104357 RepID=A0ABR3JT51_9AGAR
MKLLVVLAIAMSAYSAPTNVKRDPAIAGNAVSESFWPYIFGHSRSKQTTSRVTQAVVADDGDPAAPDRVETTSEVASSDAGPDGPQVEKRQLRGGSDLNIGLCVAALC